MFSRATKEKVEEQIDTEAAKKQDIYTDLIKEQLRVAARFGFKQVCHYASHAISLWTSCRATLLKGIIPR